MNQRSGRSGRGSGGGRGGGVVGSRARPDNTYDHQSSRPEKITGHQISRPGVISSQQRSCFGDMSSIARQEGPNRDISEHENDNMQEQEHTAVQNLRDAEQDQPQ